MFNPRISLWEIEEDRRRQIAAAARERLARGRRRRRTPGPARRSAGVLLVRLGVWLLTLQTPGSFDPDPQS